MREQEETDDTLKYMKYDSRTSAWLNISRFVFYLVLTITTIFSIVILNNIAQTYTAENMDEILTKMGNIVTCKIDYKEFHYQGLCSNNDEILSFLNQTVTK